MEVLGLEILDVHRLSNNPIPTSDGEIKIQFRIEGALKAFEFPFANESLTEPKIVFVRSD